MKVLKSMAAVALFSVVCGFSSAPVWSMADMSGQSINEAIKYGLVNQDLGLSTFMGSNWQEGPNGSLLNIYTPFMEIALKARRKKLSSNPTPEDIMEGRKRVGGDIDYLWTHPTVKYIVSFYGNSPTFAKDYYAVIEGVGKGRSYRLLPIKSVPQYQATKDDNAKEAPYSAINTYQFKFDDIARLENYTLRLFTKNGDELKFPIKNKRVL